MKVFLAALATETNSFSSIPTSQRAFELGCSRGDAVYEDDAAFGPLARMVRGLAHEVGGQVTPSIFAFAQPGGPTVQGVYEAFRDSLLADLRAAADVGMVLLILHGAMIAQETWDCEGDILRRVREIVGPQVPVGVVLDPHAHLTDAMVEAATVLSFQKEYPHTDLAERTRDVFRLCLGVARGEISPTPAVHDCRMVSFWPTQVQPMRGFVDRMIAHEGEGGILSVSFIHGFPWGDTPATGARMLVYADGDAAAAQALARALGEEIWALREETRTPVLSMTEGVAAIAAGAPGLMVVADMADNPGGGAPSDATFLLQAVRAAGIEGVAFGLIYDPQAVAFCHEVGEGASFDLRIGGKVGPTSGAPVDLPVTVMGLSRNASQVGLSGAESAFGPAAWVRGEGLDIVLSQERVQCVHPSAFTNLGVPLTDLRAVVVKSTNHFAAGFAPIAARTLYVDTPGAIRPDFAQIPYRRFKGPFWPRDFR